MTSASMALRPYRFPILFSLLTLLLGFGLGIAFGVGEKSIKASLKDRAELVLDSVYEGNEAKMDQAKAKGWSYLKRAHLHAGAIGGIAIGLILLLALSRKKNALTLTSAWLLGAGSFAYSLYWLVGGFLGPAIGGSHAVKEQLAWLAMPSSGGLTLGLALSIILISASLFGPIPKED